VQPSDGRRLRRRAIFLDRDGVLNEALVRDGKPFPPASVTELRITADAPSALAALAGAGLVLIGVTNQPDVARGTQRREIVEAINAEILAVLPLQEILVCYHDDANQCDCRKPKPGLLFRAAAHYEIDLRGSFLVGDRWKDVEAGHQAGCTTVLIGLGYGEAGSGHRPNYQTHSLSDAAAWILGQAGGRDNKL
jgi:D-glycero-D-manno-heptose 1,7-bisphosphate phosphatase